MAMERHLPRLGDVCRYLRHRRMSDKLHSAQLKIKRAKKHIGDLETAILSFRHSNPYEIGTKQHPESGCLIYYMTKVDPVPEDISLVVVDERH